MENDVNHEHIHLQRFIAEFAKQQQIQHKTKEFWPEFFSILMKKDYDKLIEYLGSFPKELIDEKLSLIYDKEMTLLEVRVHPEVFKKIEIKPFSLDKTEIEKTQIVKPPKRQTSTLTFKVDETIVKEIPQNKNYDVQDWKKVRHGRDTHVGFPLSNFIQPAPIFFSEDAHNIWIGDIYRGASCFLVLGGPSFGKLLDEKFILNGKEYSTKELLEYPGHIIAGVNNSPKSIRPNIWISVDHPQRFIKSIFIDPKIQKFVPLDHADKHIFDSTLWDIDDLMVGECPNVIYYRRNERFQPDQFLWEDTINWGEHKDYGGKRSVMLAAMRILFNLGIRKVYLLGCDFKMDENYTYHFDQKRATGSVSSNNATYKKLQERFLVLKPIFDQNGFEVYNCNPESGLTAFPYKSFIECIEDRFYEMPDIVTEKSNGLYDRKITSIVKPRKNEDDMTLLDVLKTIAINDKNNITFEESNDNGILYYNSGTKCLARLLTSVHSLRKVYDGKICILSTGEESSYACKSISKMYNCMFKEVSNSLNIKHDYWFEKSRMHLYTPFENTLFIDSDTIIQKDPSVLFDEIEKNDFIVPQFSSWTTKTKIIQKRLHKWDMIDIDLVNYTIQKNDPSVNVGVFGFNKKSLLMKNWFDFTIQNLDAVLPEESSCHLLLNLYKGKIIDSKYNYSCKHDKKNIDDSIIIHYHGNKHCRLDQNGSLLYNAEKWLEHWKEIYYKNICFIQKWYNKIGDGKLKEYMESQQ